MTSAQAILRWRRAFGALVTLSLLDWSATTARAADPAAPIFTSNASVHDPSVVRDGNTFYVFGSHLASASTTDLMNWTQISTSAVVGNALVPNPLTEFAEALTWASTNTFWAPDVIKLADGRYYFYYCTCKGDSPVSALGLATADAITGPYKNAGIMLKSGMWGLASPDGTIYDATKHPNVVDPSVYFDPSGRLWMVYGSYSGGLFVLELDASTGVIKPGQGYGKRLIGGNHARIEGGYVLYHPDTAYFYLFMSFGGLDTVGGYNIRVGRSRNPDGPYLDSAGTDLATVKGASGTLFDDASIAPHGVKLMGNYQFLRVAGEAETTSRGYLSPGHNSAYRDPTTKQLFLVFHTRFVGRGEQHEVRVHQMFMNEAGWPVVAPHRYAQETLAATDAGDLTGDFKLINHGKAISTTVNQSVVVTFNADGSITGGATGTWALSGAHYANLTIGGTLYRGVYSRHWDDDQRRWVPAFSALSDNGVAIWGSKVTIYTAPALVAHPTSTRVKAGASVVLSVAATGSELRYQWTKAGTSIDGATSPTLSLTTVTSASAGDYRCVITGPGGTATSDTATVSVAAASATNGALSALSLRGRVGTGADALFVGLVTESTAELLFKANGPGLGVAPYNVPGVLADPKLDLYDVLANNAQLAANDNWSGTAELVSAINRSGAFPLADSTSNDAAILRTLPSGIYTAKAAGVNDTTGVALVEFYSLATPAGLSALSIRGKAGAGADAFFVGFVIGGETAKTVLIKANGPGLGLPPFNVPGVLADPQLEVYDALNNNRLLARNDNWGGTSPLVEANQRSGAFPLTDAASKDAVVMITLPPGIYTAKASGANDSTGVVLLEIYGL